MRLTLAAVGRARKGPLKSLYEDYVGRLSWRLELREVEEKRKLSPAELKAREGELLLAAAPKAAKLVALDAGGRSLDSLEFAKLLGHWRDAGRAEVAFVIGGAEGLDEAVLTRADVVLSLGAMTWPHMLVRVMLAEQIFRAQSILSGHPYHRA
jgi:23S rRNA (pseudouridine1915-N3)-methyltransferase